MRVRCVPLVLAVIVISFVVSGLSPGLQAAGHETLVVEGNELTACTPPQLMCFDVVSGDLATDIREGENVIVTLRPVGEAPHNLNVIEEANSDPLHLDTDAGQAIGSSSTADSGLETSFQFEAPAAGTVLYFWCDIVEHEIFGMWFTATVAPAPAGEPGGGNNTTGGPSTQNQTMEPGNTTLDPDNGTTGNATVEDDNATADGNATVANDEGTVKEDAAGPAWFVAVVAAVGIAWRARTRRN